MNRTSVHTRYYTVGAVRHETRTLYIHRYLHRHSKHIPQQDAAYTKRVASIMSGVNPRHNPSYHARSPAPQGCISQPAAAGRSSAGRHKSLNFGSLGRRIRFPAQPYIAWQEERGKGGNHRYPHVVFFARAFGPLANIRCKMVGGVTPCRALLHSR